MIERWADYLPSSTAGCDGLLRPMIPNCLQCSIRGEVNKKQFTFDRIFVDFQPPL
jgi:hypothetical protein